MTNLAVPCTGSRTSVLMGGYSPSALRAATLVGQLDGRGGDVLLQVRDADDVPGIGSMTGERRSSQASASCDGDAPCSLRRSASSGPPAAGQLAGREREPRDEGDALRLARGRAPPRPAVRRGCRGSAPRRSSAIFCAACSSLDGDLAAGRCGRSCPRPAAASARRPGPRAAPSGRCGAAATASIRSRPRWRRLSSACWRRYSGRPTGRQSPGPERVKPGLGGDDQVVGVRVQRLLDQLLG